MTKADKMFEDLGYKHYVSSKTEIYVKGEFASRDLEVIHFFLDTKEVLKEENYTYASKIPLEELNAINQKCKELGWLDE